MSLLSPLAALIAGIPVAGTQHIGEIGHLPLQIVHVILQLVDLADALFHQICRVIGNGRRTVHAYVGAQQKTSQSDDEHRNASQQRALRAVFAYVPGHDFPIFIRGEFTGFECSHYYDF